MSLFNIRRLLREELKQNDYESIDTFHKFCSFIFVIPHWDLKSKDRLGWRTLVKLTAVLIFLASLYVYTIFAKIQVYIENIYGLPPKVIILDYIFYTSQTIENVLAILINTVRFGELKKFMEIIANIDTELERTGVENKKRYVFSAEIILIHLLFFVSCFIYDPRVFVYMFPKHVQVYHTTMAILLMYKYLMCMKTRIARLNSALENAVVAFVRSSAIHHKDGVENDIASLSVRIISGLYLQVLQLIEIFNLTFQWQILFIAVRIACENVMFFTVIVSLIKRDRFDSFFVFITISRTSLIWILAQMLALSADKLMKEVNKLHHVCRKLYIDLVSLGNRNKTCKILADQIFLVSQCYDIVAPQVTASDIFPTSLQIRTPIKIINTSSFLPAHVTCPPRICRSVRATKLIPFTFKQQRPVVSLPLITRFVVHDFYLPIELECGRQQNDGKGNDVNRLTSAKE
ncbi:hypothetical protein Trydic_g9529 [Trypoxylus dichotomus]